MTSLSNVWDANETWLVLMGGALFGAFPVAYGTILSALYIPVLTMIFALSIRAVAFEFRELSRRKRFWNNAFGVAEFRRRDEPRICARECPFRHSGR